MIRLADFLEEDGHEVSVLVPLFLTEKITSKKVEVITFDVRFTYFCHDLSLCIIVVHCMYAFF